MSRHQSSLHHVMNNCQSLKSRLTNWNLYLSLMLSERWVKIFLILRVDGGVLREKIALKKLFSFSIHAYTLSLQVAVGREKGRKLRGGGGGWV